jgi:hypothetical protein
MLTDKKISEISEKALKMCIMGNLNTSKSDKVSPHFFIDRYKPTITKLSFMLTSIRTSLGSFWEVIAEEFAKENGYEVFKQNTFQESKLLGKAETEMNKFIDERLHKKVRPISDFCTKLDRIYEQRKANPKTKKWVGGAGADLYFKKDGKIWIFDVKTVQINAGGGNKFDRQLINWLVHQKHQVGNTMEAKDITVGYIFPYNSKAGGDETSHEEWMSDQGHKAKPMTNAEIYAGNKFWEMITENPKALRMIFEGIESVLKDNIVKKHLDEAMKEENWTKEQHVSFSVSVTKDFVKYLFDVDFDRMEKNIAYWSHVNGSKKCTFQKSINSICNTKRGGGTGLDRYLRAFDKCPKCKEKISMVA